MLLPITIVTRMNEAQRDTARQLTNMLDLHVWSDRDLMNGGRSFNVTSLISDAPLIQEYFESLKWYVILWRYYEGTEHVRFFFTMKDPMFDRSKVYLPGETSFNFE